MAVKLFRLDLPPGRVHQLVAEFERLIAAAVTHPAVIAPVATGIQGVSAYLVQDYVAAESLDITLRRGPSSAADALRVGTRVAGALDAAAAVHIEHGVLHPRDVLLSADEARLAGLGLARAVERVGVLAQVRRPFTAPERTVGSPWDRRADVFGLAAMIHEMLWGRRRAAAGDEAADALTEIAGGDLPRLRAVFGRALADDPAERFDTALAFAGALKAAFLVPPSREASADRKQVVRLKAYTTYEGVPTGPEPRLPFEPPAGEKHEPARDVVTAVVEKAEKAVEREPDPVVMRADLDLRPPVQPPDLMESHRPSPDSVRADERSRSAISPLAFALLIGAALGFAAGFGVGTWSRPPDPGEPARSDAAVASTTDAAPATEPAREITDRTVQVGPPKPTTAPPMVGSLLVRSTPPGARVFVDGREYGRTPLTVGNLSRGARSVRVIRDGYVTEEREITVTSAQRAQSMTVRLSPDGVAPVASAVGRQAAPSTAPLTVLSRRDSATVFLDGQLVGTTPLVVPDVVAGEHALHLDRDGYRRWSSAIRIVTTEKNRVTASLDR